MNSISIRVEGLDRLIAKLRAEPLLAQPLRSGFEKVGFLLGSEARRRAPVDRGQLRASIAHQVDPSPVPTWVKVGAKPHYAPYMEYGTGLIHDHPSWPRKPHKIPFGALDGWAKRKGLDGGAVAGAVMARGGLKPRRFLRGALEDNREKVLRIISGALRAASEG